MITDKDIIEVTEAFITISNKDGGLQSIIDSCGKNSLAVRIIGTRIKTGFIVQDGKFRMLSDVDRPTVTVTLDKETYWNIINSEDPGTARAKIYLGVFTEENIVFDPPPGTDGGALHVENLIKLFGAIAKTVMN